jgi:hypothetical protein
MKDAFGVEIEVGDIVVHAAGSGYCHMTVGTVIAKTPKGVTVQETQSYCGWRLCKRTWTNPSRLLRVKSINTSTGDL